VDYIEDVLYITTKRRCAYKGG